MTKVISIHSFRGGTGKSNITANIAAILATHGHQVGIVDSDIQSPGIHIIFGLNTSTIQYTLNDYLWGRCEIDDAAYKVMNTDNGGLVYLVPSSLNANDIARILREKYDANDMHKAFRELINTLNLDYLLIDTHPGLNEETLLSVAISDILLIILRPDKQDFEGTDVTIDLARRLKVPNMLLAINKIPPDYDFPVVKEQVEGAYNCTVGALIPLSFDVAQNASEQLFCLTYPEHLFSQGVNALVTQILDAS